jgi:Glycine zipper
MRNPAAVAGCLLAPVLLALAPPVAGQVPSPQDLGVFVYPAKGQPAAQQQAEAAECYAWAQKQTGIDPLAPPPPPPPPKQQGADGSAVKGAAGGALVGTAVGAIAGDAGEGAAIGAVAGGVRGRRMAKKQQKGQEQQAQQQSQAQHASAQETFKKAYGACLEGKGYTVK